MANYLLQIDPSGTCCDCATRASPCDACSCLCPHNNLNVSATINVTINDTRNCTTCGSNDCNVQIATSCSGNFPVTNFCSLFGVQSEACAHTLINTNSGNPDGSANCSAFGALNLAGSISAQVGIQQGADFNNPPCDGYIQLVAVWQASGHLQSGTHVCGDDCQIPPTTNFSFTENFPIADFYSPTGTYVMDHTTTRTNYSSHTVITAVIAP